MATVNFVNNNEKLYEYYSFFFNFKEGSFVRKRVFSLYTNQRKLRIIYKYR